MSPAPSLRLARWVLRSCAAVLGGLCLLGEARAESHGVGLDYLERPLILPEGVLRLDGGPKRPYFGGQVSSGGQLQVLVAEPGSSATQLVAGAAYGFGDGWEGGAALPLQLNPRSQLGDLALYGLYNISANQEISAAAFAELKVPIQSDLELAMGVPLQVRLAPDVRLDSGAFLRVGFSDGTPLSLFIPAAVPIRVAPAITVGPDAGVELADLENLAIPVGVQATYSFSQGLRSTGDALARFALVDVTDGANWRLDAAFNAYFDL